MAEEQTPGDERLPGAVSNQNSEEQPSEAGDQQEGRQKPRGSGGSDDKTGGEASEGTQSTGHPGNAG